MQSKVFLSLAVLLAVLFLVSSIDVAPKAKPDEAHSMKQAEAKEPEQQGGGQGGGGGGGGGGCRYGCCGGWNYGYCRRCCYDAKEAVAAAEAQVKNQQEAEAKEPEQQGGGGGGGGGGCRYGCCGGWNYGYCRRCCYDAKEAVAVVEAQVKNQQEAEAEAKEPEQQGGGGGGGGGRCQYGCCGGWNYGYCRRCCYANEAVERGN